MKWTHLLLILAICAGCAVDRQQGGWTRRLLISPGRTNTVEMRQSDNPKQGAKQNTETVTETKLILPAGSKMELPPVQQGTNLVHQFATLKEPTPITTISRDTTRTEIGGAQTDTVGELGVKVKAMAPVLIAGIGLVGIGVLLAYFGWWTKAALCGVVGVGMIVLTQIIPGHEGVIIGVGLSGVAILAFLILYVYHKGHLDALP
jgi:hypothetical protein